MSGKGKKSLDEQGRVELRSKRGQDPSGRGSRRGPGISLRELAVSNSRAAGGDPPGLLEKGSSTRSHMTVTAPLPLMMMRKKISGLSLGRGKEHTGNQLQRAAVLVVRSLSSLVMRCPVTLSIPHSHQIKEDTLACSDHIVLTSLPICTE